MGLHSRRLICIRCGCPRGPGANDSDAVCYDSTKLAFPSRALRLTSAPNLAALISNKDVASHPPLTPSGRAVASGGKVQNISSDPASQCIMYWPDNELFPEQGQISLL
ncbi:hypothetical protein B0H13DRAFT_1592446 [Mycena leptocephala]|nr:hypothetical protein B0H13DRAFT_1592446 [Mycena leptocephala]